MNQIIQPDPQSRVMFKELNKKLKKHRKQASLLFMKQQNVQAELTWHENQVTQCIKNILICWDQDQDQRKQASRYMQLNERPSQFHKILPPQRKPGISFNIQFATKYPLIAKKFMTYETQNIEEDFFKLEQMIDFYRSRYVALLQKINIISKKWGKQFKRKGKASAQIGVMKIIHNFPPWNILLQNQDHKWLKVEQQIYKKTCKFTQKHLIEFERKKFYRENGEANQCYIEWPENTFEERENKKRENLGLNTIICY